MPFERAGAENSSIQGTGIGLALCKNYIEAMGGTIGVTSDKGSGSTFWFELSSDKHNNVIEMTKDFGRDHSLQQMILYIENNPENLKLAQNTISNKTDYKLITTAKPLTGFTLAEKYRPDLILLNTKLSSMDDFDISAELNNNTELQDIPVIAITASTIGKGIQIGANDGFDDYITTPIDAEKLLNAINMILSE